MRRLLRKAAAMLLPGPPRHERKAAIAAARRERERSEADAEHARRLAAELQRLGGNGYAMEIAAQIRRGYRPRAQ